MPHGTNSAVVLDIASKGKKWVGETHYCGWLRWVVKVVNAVRLGSRVKKKLDKVSSADSASF